MTVFTFKNRIRNWPYPFPAMLFSLCLVLNACAKNRIEPEVETFPMAEGSEWHYQQTFYQTIFESDSTEVVVDMDTIQNIYRIWVSKDTVLNDTMQVTLFESSEEGSENWIWRQYYYLDDEGLRLYAYYHNTGPISFRKSTATFNNHPAIQREWTMGIGLPDPGDGMIFMNPPTLNLQLPLTEDSYWTYLQSNSSPDSRIDKEVTGTGLIKAAGTEFACFRVDWIYLNNFPELEIQVTDWIAEAGLIKRIVTSGRTDVYNIDGEYLYNGQITEVLQLVDLDLN
jgi:hypothetical protein